MFGSQRDFRLQHRTFPPHRRPSHRFRATAETDAGFSEQKTLHFLPVRLGQESRQVENVTGRGSGSGEKARSHRWWLT